MSKRSLKSRSKNSNQKPGSKQKNIHQPDPKPRHPSYDDNVEHKEPYYHPPLKVGRLVH